MKRHLACTVVLLLLLSVSYTNATLLRVADMFGEPDVEFNNTARMTYDPETQELLVTGRDLKMRYPSGSGFYPGDEKTLSIIDPDLPDSIQREIEFEIRLTVNNDGELLGGYMKEWISLGEIKLKNLEGVEHTYSASDNDTMLLEGDVTALGWDNSGTYSNVDFLVPVTSGRWVDDGLWGDQPDGTGYGSGTGILINTHDSSQEVNFSVDYGGFNFYPTKGDKAPLIPEPGTLLLLGSGLVGLAGYARRRKKKS